ncbi:MAG: IS66 family transposase [Mogibacterium sp.]|nr:IS66 family transposase [Mogibacterium sp.]
MGKTISREELNKMDKDVVITLLLGMQDQLAKSNETIEALRATVEKLTEQIAIMNTRMFGKSSEKSLAPSDQLSLYDFGFNEAELLAQEGPVQEPEMETVIVHRKKRKGKRDEDLSGFEAIPVEHGLSDEELADKFPEGYYELDDEVYRKLEVEPAVFKVIEHHIKVYKGKNGTIVKGRHPKEMLNNSIATPSLAAFIMNAKYVNAVPLYRQEQEFARNDVNISRQVMANWMITTAERYLSLVYDRLKEEIVSSPVAHADETPVQVTNDGREGIHKSYMWVYRTGNNCKANPAIVYDYQKTRKADAPRAFLEGFKGRLVCDGYQVYHTLEGEAGTDFTVAGCWIHARRPFADVIKSLGEDKASGTLAYEAYVQIQNIYHTDNSLKKLPPSERKKKRKKLVKPLVDTFFDWARSVQFAAGSGKTKQGIQYCLNQEKYLRAFLDDPALPLDNNIAEQAIRPFCVGRNNWKLIDTVGGADASAIIYSIVETAKANDLNIYKYLKYLLTEIPQHMDETSTDFIEDLLPWSRSLPPDCRKKKASN